MARARFMLKEDGPVSFTAGGVTARRGTPVETDDPLVIALFTQSGFFTVSVLAPPPRVAEHPIAAPRSEPGTTGRHTDLPPPPVPEYDDHDDSDLPSSPPPAPPVPVDEGMRQARKRQGKRSKKDQG